MLQDLREAIEANRIDLYLQPIVTLPDRKLRYYDASTRIRTGDDAFMPPATICTWPSASISCRASTMSCW